VVDVTATGKGCGPAVRSLSWTEDRWLAGDRASGFDGGRPWWSLHRQPWAVWAGRRRRMGACGGPWSRRRLLGPPVCATRQQSGHESRFEAETGRPFKNGGDCASHGAQGGDEHVFGYVESRAVTTAVTPPYW